MTEIKNGGCPHKITYSLELIQRRGKITKMGKTQQMSNGYKRKQQQTVNKISKTKKKKEKNYKEESSICINKIGEN